MEQNLQKIFAQLETAGRDGDFEKCLKLTDKILSALPEDQDALRCKITCLIHLSKFKDALKLIDKSSGYLFEKAYCLYRLDQFEQSTQVLNSLSQSEVRVRELQAQIHYKCERYREAVDTYTLLVGEASDEFSNDRQANRAAALSLGSVTHSTNVPTHTFEQCFNTACCLLNSGCGQEATDMLVQAEELCRQSLLEEGYAEEEIEEELGVVRVQRGYALQIQGRSKEALELYSAVLKLRPDDITQTVVASNNIIVINKDKDVFDSKKKIKALVSEGSSKRLTRAQKMTILYNRCLFALQTNQLEQCRELVSSFSASFPHCDLKVLANVALFCRERKLGEAIECMNSHLTSQSTSDVTLHLTLAQLYSQQGHLDKAAALLGSVPHVSRHLGVVSTLVSLYTGLGEVARAVQILDSAVEYWKREGEAEWKQVMLESGKYKLVHCKPQEAAVVLEELRKQSSDDIRVTALLISTFSRYNPKLAEDLSRSLEPNASLRNSSVDIDTLEQMPSFRHSRRQVHKPEAADRQSDKSVAKQRKRKKRKPRLPKNFDPNTPADKERWLPLRERSYFRRGKRKGFIGAGRGSQGATIASASLMAQLDASKPKNTDSGGAKMEPVSPRAKPATQPQKKKPKKKKGKW